MWWVEAYDQVSVKGLGFDVLSDVVGLGVDAGVDAGLGEGVGSDVCNGVGPLCGRSAWSGCG